MSAAILGACDDVRPGLVHGTKKRQLEVEKKKTSLNQMNKDKYKPKKVLEAEKREEGLSTAIDTQNNKGFQLMAKMGFKAGMALGKKEEGRKEPVPIEVKTTREGLGRDADRKRKQKEQIDLLIKRRKQNHQNLSSITADYRHRMREKFTGRKTASDLKDAQNVCMQLDMEQEWEQPLFRWYWPDNWWKKGVKDDEEEVAADGETSSSSKPILADEEEEEEEEEYEEDEELEPSEKLEVIVGYLRTTYFYCSWCGSQYDNEEAMDASCPGESEEDHG